MKGFRPLPTLPLLALILLMATSAVAGEARPKSGKMLKLPTPAGRIAADVAGREQLQLAPLVDEIMGSMKMPAPRQDISGIVVRPSNELRPAWKLRGWFSPDGSVTRLEDMGHPIDTWSIDSWRFDALVIRTF
jgi:hypothetical protein